MARSADKSKGDWKCPKCGRVFARKSSYHGCGEYSVEGYLANKNAAGVALFKSLADAATALPGVTVSPAKTQVSFRVRANFLMVAVAGPGIGGYLFLPRPLPKPYFKKIAAASSRRHVHVFRISAEKDLRDLIALLPEAAQLVSEGAAAQNAGAEKKTPIGEEINELYRAERRVRRSAIS